MTKAQFTIVALWLKRGLILLAACFCFALVCSILFHARPVHAESYGPWDTVPYHPGVDYRVRCDCDPSSAGGRHMWWVQFRNRYDEKVAFSFRITSSGDTTAGFGSQVTINPMCIQESGSLIDVPDGGTVEVLIDNWKTGADANF
jgi:hypothetical protein